MAVSNLTVIALAALSVGITFHLLDETHIVAADSPTEKINEEFINALDPVSFPLPNSAIFLELPDSIVDTTEDEAEEVETTYWGDSIGASVQELKTSGLLRKPDFVKLDSSLNHMVATDGPLVLGEEEVTVSPSVPVVFDLTSNPHEIANQILALGGKISVIANSYIGAYIPIDMLPSISSSQDVIRISQPSTANKTIDGYATRIHNSEAWESRGLTGKDVKIGIIDKGFSGFNSLAGTELPSVVSAL
ncbi:uncharacterized protein METZ01_LOCUS328880, partial [marine metagenome]